MISIVLPVHDQNDHIEAVVSGHIEALARLPEPTELLLVSNGSRDGSADTCGALAQRSGVRHIDLERGGWGHAVRRGLAECRGELLCYANSARTTSQDLTLCLLYALANPGVVVKANRKLRDGWARRMGGLLYNIECRTLFDLGHWDVNGTPKVFPRRFDRLLSLSREDDLIDLEFGMVCRREGYPLLEVPILSSRRHGGRTTTGLLSAVRLYSGALRLYLAERQARDPHRNRKSDP
jgi:glycosyltransferase involved in cell wall biosynthesis